MLKIGQVIIIGSKYADPMWYPTQIGKAGAIVSGPHPTQGYVQLTKRTQHYQVKIGDEYDLWDIHEEDCLIIAKTNQEAKVLLDMEW